ncbi:hypothetical protein QUF76_07320 [Desulfobacterales bacterium HSG16]|nr:hypothetical protein [Desulfobacterales bacterium HSG16]
MKTFIGGAIAAVVGVITLAIWHSAFLQLLAGVIPATLLLGGCLAIYLGFDELKDNSMKKDDTVEASGKEDVQKYRSEIDKLKQEIEDLKK